MAPESRRSDSMMDNKKLSTGRIVGEDEWSRVALAVATLSQAKMYIDDDASLSVADINAKCRRISDLGLVPGPQGRWRCRGIRPPPPGAP